MTTKQTNTNAAAEVNGLIDLGYEAPDYSCPCEPTASSKANSKRKMHTVYPTFRVCQEPAAILHEALNRNKLLDGEFSAIVVLKNTMIKVADDDEDADGDRDVEMEFTIRALLPHTDGGPGETEAAILSDLDKLPKAVKDTSDGEGEEEEKE